CLVLLCDAVCLMREKGFKAGSYFYHDGTDFAYHFNTHSQTSIYFKCVFYDAGCHGRAILKLGGNFRHSKAHNHPPDPFFVQERQFRTSLLAKVRESKWVKFKDILELERFNKRYHPKVSSRMTLRRLRTTMQNERTKSHPKIPQTLEKLTDILVDPQYRWLTASVDKRDNIYAGSVNAVDGTHCVLFMSERMLDFCGRITLIQSDGTFKSRPAVPASAQVFSLVTTWKNFIIPIGWVLMGRRSRPAYDAVLELLKTLNPEICPSYVITDFEIAQQEAWKTAFPGCKVQGCLFHLSQAFIKKARKLGLAKYWKMIPEVLNYIRRCTAISLLPKNLFTRALDLLQHNVRQECIEAAYLLHPFFQYVRTKWINRRSRRDYMSFWRCEHRTNNACESHHTVLRHKMGAHHPNIFEFMDRLTEMEQTAYYDVGLLAEGNLPGRTRRYKSVLTDRRLNGLNRDIVGLRLLRNRNETILRFLVRAAELNVGLFNRLTEARQRRRQQQQY
ncbi:Alpha-galactosidase A, partial [Frankliniella fusca]